MLPIRAFVAGLALLIAGSTHATPPVATAQAEGTPGSPLESGLETIREHFLEPMQREQLETQALAALLEKLDPYSHYYDAAAMDLFRSGTEANFGGIGVLLDTDEASAYPRIDYLMHGGAAGAAGLRRGDLLVAIDGRELKSLSPDQVSGFLRGAVGTPVVLSVQRAGEPAPMEFRLTRVAVELPSVRAIRRDAEGRPDWWLDRERKLGYLRVAALAADTASRVDQALAQLQRGRARGLVLDLRDCGGGLMQAALATADLFVGRGRLLTIRERGADRRFDATPGKYTRLPLVVLINGGTASSGEILAGAIADNGRARLVGERTFGKGRIQTIYSLGEGRGGMVLSTGTFQRPNGKTIDKHDLPEGSTELAGIAPDIEVKMSEAAHAAWFDFADKTTGPLVLRPDEQRGAPPDPVLAKAVELLGREK